MTADVTDHILPQRAVAQTGLSISILGFGGVQVGDYFTALPEATAIGAISDAYAAGIRYFDTAPRYGRGLSEHRIGHVLRQYLRDDFVLSTKVGRNLEPDQSLANTPHRLGLPFKFVPDLSFDGTMRGIEQSLHRLGLSRIDFAFMHALEPREYGTEYPARFREAIDGCYRALADLRAQKVIRGIGAGINEVQASIDLINSTELDCLMLAGRYTLMEQDALDSMLPLAARRNVSIIVGAPFNSGVLATGSIENARYGNRLLEPEVLNRVRDIERVCVEFDVELAAAALQFPLAHPSVVAVVAGMSSADEVRSNVRLVNQQIPVDFWSALKQKGILRPDAPTD